MIKFNRLTRWENSLNACIRCGYCYEHCPIYKSSRWEIDAPRAKLILLYGLLHKEVELTDYLAEKLFECFHCRQCENACSSGVPLLEVFNDARADLIDAGLDTQGTTSATDHEKCAHCLNCVRMCTHEARSYHNGQISTDRLKCQSCGSCLDVCSAQAIHLGKYYGTAFAELHQAMADFLNNSNHPNSKAIVFGCSWSSYPGFQTAQFDPTENQNEYATFVTACSGRLRTQTVIEALRLGAWGVLVNCCPEDECEHGGASRARARMSALRGGLERLGMNPERVQVAEVPKDAPRAFEKTVSQFIEKIRALGPLRERSK